MRRVYRHLIQAVFLIGGIVLVVWSFWGNHGKYEATPSMNELLAFVGGIAAIILGGCFLFMDVAFQLMLRFNKGSGK